MVIAVVSGFLAAVGWTSAVVVALPSWCLLAAAATQDRRSSVLHLTSVSTSARRAIEGDEIDVSVAIGGHLGGTWLEVELELDDGLEPTQRSRRMVKITDTNAHEHALTLSYRVTAWGMRQPQLLRAAVYDRFLLVIQEQVWSLSDDTSDLAVAVHPSGLRLASYLKLHRTRPITGGHQSKARGAGMELAEVRAARPGDAVSRVHPRLTARRGVPMIVEHHPDRASDVVIVVDSTSDIGTRLDSTLRWSVQAALAVQQGHLRGMDRVGIIDFGGKIRWLEPGIGRQAAHQIVRTLLSMQAHQARGSTAADQTSNLPLYRLPPGCLTIAFSAGLSDAFDRDLVRIRRRGHQVVRRTAAG